MNSSDLQELLNSIEKHLQAEISILSEQNRKLLSENALLNQHNTTLQNCWQNERLNCSKSQQDLLTCLKKIEDLKNEVNSLNAHLNPSSSHKSQVTSHKSRV